MPTCPRCALDFRSVIYRAVIDPYRTHRQSDGTYRESLECGHTWIAPKGRTVYSVERRACGECLIAHHRELGLEVRGGQS